MAVGFVKFSRKKCYEGVGFNVISITRGWVGDTGGQISQQKVLPNA